MKSEKDIERSLRDSNLDIEINAGADRAIVNELIERHGTSTRSTRPVWALKLAAVVTIVTVIALFVFRREPSGPGPERPRVVSSLELATAISLEKAFRHGGIEAVDNQSREAFGTGQKKTEPPSIEELLTDVETVMNDQRSGNI